MTSRFENVQHGMTVSSFTSLSLEPPLVLVSLEQGARTHNLVDQSKTFGITILSSTQQEISDRFAGRETEYLDRFDGLETFTLVTGVPLLRGGLASFDCRLVGAYPASTHTIFIGDVVAAHVGNPDQSPLIYYNRGYRKLKDDEMEGNFEGGGKDGK